MYEVMSNMSLGIFCPIQMNTDDGKWNEKRYWEIAAMIKVPEWKREAEIIGNNCVDSMAFYDIWILI